MDSHDIIKHSTIIFIATLLTGMLNYAFQCCMMKMLSPADYGILLALLSVFYILTAPMTALQTEITYLLSTYQGLNKKESMKAVFYKATRHLSIIAASLSGIIMIFSSPISAFLKIHTNIYVIALCTLFFINFFLPLCYGTLSSLRSFTIIGSAAFFGALIKIIAGILLVFLGYHIFGALAALFLSILIPYLICLYCCYRYFRTIRSVPPISLKALYLHWLPVLTVLILYQTLAWFDMTLVKHFFTPLEAGYYARAALFGKAFLYIPASLAFVMFPTITELNTKGQATLPVLKKFLILSSIPLCTALLLFYVWPDPFVLFLSIKSSLSIDELHTMKLLIRYFGLAMTPISLSIVIVYYCLALHNYRILFILFPAVIISSILYWCFHAHFSHILIILGSTGVCVLGTSAWYTVTSKTMTHIDITHP